MEQEKYLPRTFPRKFIFKLAALSIGIMLPVWCLLIYRYPTYNDYIFRGMLLGEALKQFWSGDLYPRWLMYINDGLGSPVMLFQPMFSYYFAVLLQPLSKIDPHGYGRIIIIISLFLFIGGLGCYIWLREYFDDRTAQLGAILYISFPSLFIGLYEQMAPHAILAYMIYPLLLLISKRMLIAPFRYGYLYALLQAALTLTSLWNTIIFSAIPLCFVLFLSSRGQRLKNFSTIFGATILGLLLAAIYWLPITTNKNFIFYTDFIKYTSDYIYKDNFLYLSSKKAYDPWSLFARLILMYFTVIPLFIECFRLRFIELFAVYRKECLFFAIVILGASFMCFPISMPVWRYFGFLSNLQFPIKFLLVTPMAIVFIMCCWLPRIGNFLVYNTVSVISAVLFFLFTANVFYDANMDKHHANIFEHELLYEKQNMTIWMKKAGIKDPTSPPSRFLNVPPSNIIDGKAEISEVKQTPRSISFKANVISQSAKVALKRYYYPGWIVPEGMPSGISIAEHDALLAVNLPHGQYDVTITQPWFPGEKEAVLMSSAGLAIVLAWAAMARRRIYS